MAASEPKQYEQLQYALSQFDDAVRRPENLGDAQIRLWNAAQQSLTSEAQELKSLIEQTNLNAPNSPSRIRTGMQTPLDVINFLKGPGGKAFQAAVTKQQQIADKIDARQMQQMQAIVRRKKLIRNLLILAGLYRLSKKKAFAQAANDAVIQEQIQAAEENVDENVSVLNGLFDQENGLENELASIEDKLSQNDAEHQLLQDELTHADELFSQNESLHEQTATLLNPDNSTSPEHKLAHQEALRARLAEHQQALKSLSASQVANNVPQGHAVTNLKAIQLEMLALDTHLDLLLVAEASGSLNPAFDELMLGRQARESGEEEKARGLFTHARDMLADLGIIDPEQDADDEFLASHCGHFELLDGDGGVLAPHQRSQADCMIRIGREERLVHRDGQAFLIPKHMSDDDFATQHRDGKAQHFQHRADKQRHLVATHRYKKHLTLSITANREKHQSLQIQHQDCQQRLTAVREEISQAQIKLEASIQTVNQLYEQADLSTATAARARPVPRPTPNGQAFLRDAEAILSSRDLTSAQKLQQIKQIMPERAVHRLMPELAKMENGLLSQLGQDPDAFRNEFAEMLRQNGNLFNEYRAVSGPYKEVEASGGTLTKDRQEQLGEPTTDTPEADSSPSSIRSPFDIYGGPKPQ